MQRAKNHPKMLVIDRAEPGNEILLLEHRTMADEVFEPRDRGVQSLHFLVQRVNDQPEQSEDLPEVWRRKAARGVQAKSPRGGRPFVLVLGLSRRCNPRLAAPQS